MKYLPGKDSIKTDTQESGRKPDLVNMKSIKKREKKKIGSGLTCFLDESNLFNQHQSL